MMNWLDGQFGMVTTVSPDGRSQDLPAYVCGHCSDVVVLNPARQRPRRKCGRCGAMLCEERQVCLAECIPQHSLLTAEPNEPLARRAAAVLDGARTSAEVDAVTAA